MYTNNTTNNTNNTLLWASEDIANMRWRYPAADVTAFTNREKVNNFGSTCT